MSVHINLLPRKTVRERVWKTLNVVVGITTILNVSMVGALIRPTATYAATEGGSTPTITAKDHEGQKSDGTWSNGDITQYAEGDYINFRFNLKAEHAPASGQLEVRFTGNDSKCLFFDNYFSLGAITNVSGTSPSIVVASGPTAKNFGTSNGEWVMVFNVGGSANGEATVNYTLKLSEQAGECNGSSQHSRLNPAGGNVEQTGAQNVPVPANKVIVRNLSIQKSDSPDPINLNATTKYSLLVKNTGEQAETVTVVDTLPSQMTYVDGSASITPSVVGNVLTWSGIVLAKDTGSTTIYFDAKGVAVGTWTNTASVSATGLTPVTDTEDTTVRGQCALRVTKTVDKPTANPGDVLTYTIKYDNNDGTAFCTGSGVNIYDQFSTSNSTANHNIVFENNPGDLTIHDVLNDQDYTTGDLAPEVFPSTFNGVSNTLLGNLHEVGPDESGIITLKVRVKNPQTTCQTWEVWNTGHTDGTEIQSDVEFGSRETTKTVITTPCNGSLVLAKNLTGAPQGYTEPFSIHYNCGANYTGDKSVTANSSVTVPGIPVNTSCTVSEPNLPTAPSGYSFGTPTFNPSNATVTIPSNGTDVTVTTYNTLTRDTGTLVLAKNLTGGPQGYTGPFTIHYNCGASYTGDKSVAAGTTESVRDIPTGTSCVVSEPNLPTAPNDYSFGAPTFTPSNATVTIPAGANSSVTVTTNNTLTRNTGALTVKKNVDTDGDGKIDVYGATNWTWDITDGEQDIATGQSRNLVTGNYTISEDQKDGYHVTDLTCNGRSLGAVLSAQIALGTQGTTCTYTNTRDKGHIQLKKVWIGTPSQATIYSGTTPGGMEQYTLKTGLDGAGPLSTDNIAAETDTYYFTEVPLPGYTSTIACTDDGQPVTLGDNNSAVLARNHNLVCTFTNTRDTGMVRVHKMIGAQEVTDGWFWGVNGGQQHIAMGGQNPITLNTGAYSVTEEQHSDYHSLGWVCYSGDVTTSGQGETASFTLGRSGADCWFTNSVNTGTISGIKWVDTNGNGIREALEPVYAGGVEIWLSNGWYTTTDSNGTYSFINVPAGPYTVSEKVPDGWMNTTPKDVSVALLTNGDAKVADFGNFQLGKISGFKSDTNEKKLDGWKICLVKVNEDTKNTVALNSIQSIENCRITGSGDWADGYYEFTGLLAGHYHVIETMQAGWTNVSSLSQDVTVVSGTNASINFVNRQLFPDLTVTKDDGRTTRVPGETYSYTVVVTNQGEADAVNPWAVDTMPDFMAYQSSTIDGVPATPDQVGQQLSWHLNTLTPGSQHTIVVTVKLSALFPNGQTNVRNCVNINVDAIESNGNNNLACDTDTVTAAPTISIDKSGPATVTAGGNIVYNLVWTVSGNAPATNAAVTDSVPANTTFVSSSCGTVTKCSMSAVGSKITWDLGTRNPGDTGTVTMTVKSLSPITNGTVVTNQACFDTTETDQTCDSTTTKVESAPILSITKTNDVIGFTNPGKQATYTITVTNAATATDTAKNVVLTDTLPTGFTFVDTGLATKTTAVGDLAPGVSKVFTFLVNISAAQTAGTYTNTATAKGDNTSTVTATSPIEIRVPSILGVTAEPSLVITKTVDTKTTNPGKTVTYTVTISNAGDVDLTNVSLNDKLPKGFTFVDSGKATKTWSIGTLKAHHQRVINYLVKIGTSVKAGSYENLATALSNELDPQTAKAKVAVVVPKVLGLATTGASMRDYLTFACGLGLMSLGLYWIGRLRRREYDADRA